jgi:hypothetical protein
MPRSASAWTRSVSLMPANERSCPSSRWRISPAAFLVNVMARMSCGATPSSRERTMRDTSIHVLPAPAQASTATLRAGSQATA